MSKKNEQAEEVVDAKGGTTEVAVKEQTAVSTQVAVAGVQLDFPFIRIRQGMSQWKVTDGRPIPGALYIGKNKDANALVADAGRENGFLGIVLQKVDGYKEDRVYDPANKTAPERWVIAGQKEDGTPVTEKDVLEAAAEKGFSLVPKQVVKDGVPQVWKDSGRPMVRANLSKFSYLMMLVQLPDDFASDDFRLYTIGGKFYTTARYEFDKQYFKDFDQKFGTFQSRAEFAFAKSVDAELAAGKIDKAEADRRKAEYRWTPNGMAVHLFSTEVTNKQGISYPAIGFERALRDGKPFEFTPQEKEDFVKFLASVQAGMANVGDAGGDSEFE